MKRIMIMVAIIETGVFLFAQESPKAGKIREIDLAKKEILVSYDQVGSPYKMGDKLHIIIDDESVTLEVIFPMQTVARCKLAAKDSQKFGMLKKGMLVYIGIKAPDEYPAGTTKTIGGIEMVFCPSGSFMMGSVTGDIEAKDDEKPRHKITLDGFWIGKYEVTQEQYTLITGSAPSHSKRKPNNPVEGVNWYDAVEFCNVLSIKAGLNSYYKIDKKNKDPKNTNENDELRWTVTEIEGSNGFRLPTEAEWEYACRADSVSKYYWGDSNDFSIINQFTVYYNRNFGRGENDTDWGTQKVGLKKANRWGLYDMIGNVWEWCWDWFDDRYYIMGSTKNPKGVDVGRERILRGGSRSNTSDTVVFRSSNRYNYNAATRSGVIGFRVVCSAHKK